MFSVNNQTRNTFLIQTYYYILFLSCMSMFWGIQTIKAKEMQMETPVFQTHTHSLSTSTMQLENTKTFDTQTKQQDSLHTTKYSIISDLREAFEPYSILNKEYQTFIKQLDSKHKPPSYNEYITLLSTFNPQLIILHNSINSFDLQNYQTALKIAQNKILEHLMTNKEEDKTPSTNQKNDKQSESKIDLNILAPKCVNKKFNIKKEGNLSSKEILFALAKQCAFSIQYTHGKHIKKSPDSISIANIEDKTLDFILTFLLHDVFYTIEPNVLVIKEFDMQIFELNYISSTRMAQSNTDVLFSQEQQQNSLSNGFQGYYPNTINNPINNNNTMQQHHYTNIDNMSLKNQLRNQMSNTNTQFGKSGTKIYSVDESNFWADIATKLQIMLDEKLGDKFIIDKSAGLISVWTTKPKMQEVALFLKNLENKMNLQVAIDVEILSLLHFNASNIGINWKEIFTILNPSTSKLNIGFGLGGASLTLGNNNADLDNLFNLLKTYGDLRSLSNPKIIALNNQPAIISVGSVLRYSQNLVYQSNNTNNTIQNTSTQYPSIFSGILLDITPSISNDSVILRINPSITKTKDPEIENASQALNSPPNLSTNQLSSIVKLKDGERVIIGGLLNNVSQNITQGIPKIGEQGFLKRVFGKESRIQRNEELIIIITPYIKKP